MKEVYGLYSVPRFGQSVHEFTAAADSMFPKSLLFKRVVARRAVYHTINVITISLYVHPSVCVKWV